MENLIFCAVYSRNTIKQKQVLPILIQLYFAESPEAPDLFCAEFTDKESKCTVQAISMWQGVPFAYEVYWIPTAIFPADYKDMDSLIYKDFTK